MSSLLILQKKGLVIFASDTALTLKLNDKSYRASNNEQKIFDYGNFIMFASGKKELRDILISELESNAKVSNVKSILENKIKPISTEFSLEVAIKKKGSDDIIFFSSNDGFIKREAKVLEEGIQVFTSGYKTQEINDIFTEKINTKPVIESLCETYKEISCVEIGGNLEVFICQQEDISVRNFEIDDMKTYSLEEAFAEYFLVHADRLVGKVILGNQLVLESDSGILESNGATTNIYDRNGRLRVQLGEYPDPRTGALKHGLNVLDGAIDIRTSSNNNRGIQMDSNGFRAFNNNGVRTFNVDSATGLVSVIGGFDIRTSESTNRGIRFDGNGISGYDGNGYRQFHLDTNGNLTANNGYFSGTINATSGTLGDLNVTGTLTGGNFASGVFRSGTIIGNRIQGNEIEGGTIVGTDIYGTNITGASFNGGTIRVATDVFIGDNLYLGDRNDYYTAKSIYFNTGAVIQGGGIGPYGAGLLISSDSLTVRDSSEIFLNPDANNYGYVKSRTDRLEITRNTVAPDRLVVRVDGRDVGEIQMILTRP